MKDKHNRLGCLLLCDNLNARIADEVKEIFHSDNEFLRYFHTQNTESIQPIDAVFGRSLRCVLDNLLNK